MADTMIEAAFKQRIQDGERASMASGRLAGIAFLKSVYKR